MDAVWIVVLLAVYLIPALIVVVRRPTMTLFVIALNVLLGWTIVGWFVSLALAILLPPAMAQPAQPSVLTASGIAAVQLPTDHVDFIIDPMRVAALSLCTPIVYQYWWFWRFFQFAKHERFPRSRSFWWILVPLYGYAVIGRLFHDLQSRLGPARPQAFNAQVALALVVAANVCGGWAVRMPSTPLVVGGLAVSCVFTAMALYQVQVAVNTYMGITHPAASGSSLFPGEVIAVVAGLAALGLLALGTPQRSGRPAAQVATVPVVRPSVALTTPSPTAATTAAPIPATGNVLSMTSQPGDFIGQGRATTMTQPTWRFLANQANGSDSVTVSVETVATENFVRWIVWIAAPRGQSLHPGTYSNAERAAFRTGSAPGIDVFGDGRGCNNVYGSFAVTKLTVDQQGNVQRFEATFEQHCESRTAPALRGFIRIGSDPQPESAGLPAGYRLSPLG